MASQRMIRREKKRIRLQNRLHERRKELCEQVKNPDLDYTARLEIYAKIEKMPRDSSRIRLSRRCKITGRGRGVLRKFGLGRNELRRRTMSGEVPGLVKASW